MKKLYNSPNLTIEHNTRLETVYLTWQGNITAGTIKDAGYNILTAIKNRGATKILNDSSAVQGDWSAIAEWVVQEWFPQIFKLGINFFAWLLPVEHNARISAEDALPRSRFVKAFTTKQDADTWLNQSSTTAWIENTIMHCFITHNTAPPDMQIVLNYKILIVSDFAKNLAKHQTQDAQKATRPKRSRKKSGKII